MKCFFADDFIVQNISVACYVAPGTGTPVHKNRPHHGLVYVTAGVTYFRFSDGKSLKTEEGDIIYLPLGSDYTVQVTPESSCYAINFDISDNRVFKPFVLKTKNRRFFCEQFEKAEQTWRKKNGGYLMKSMSQLYGIIYDMKHEYEIGYISKSDSNVLLPAIEYIHREYADSVIKISQLSELCGISETYFRRQFQKIYGTSPVKYINNLRIQRAKELISSGLYSVCEVAFLSGYRDESYFSREFKKATGLSPSEMAKE